MKRKQQWHWNQVAAPALAAAALHLTTGPAWAQNESDAAKFPNKPIRFVVPSSPGGGLDVLTRLVAPKMAETWGKPIIVDNRSGAGGIIGYEIVAKAPPDGHTILMVAGGYALNPLLYAKLPFDTIGDFERVSLLACAPNVLVVHSSVPATTVNELIALAKAKPKQINYASAGVGTTSHLSALMLMHLAGVDLVHVPYKGAGDASAAIASGQVQLTFMNPNAAMSNAKAGRVRALGITASRRLHVIPDVPSIAESVPGYDTNNCFGVVVPSKTPRTIVNMIHTELFRIMQLPEMRAQLVKLGYDIIGSTPEAFTAFVKKDMARWSKALAAAGVKPQ